MLFEELEIEMRDLLTTKFGEAVDVELEPEVELANKKPFIKPRVSIMYDQSEFEKSKTTQYIAQDETGRIVFLLRSRTLRGAKGIWTLANNVRKYIVGYQPKNWSKISLVKFSFVKRGEGLWEWTLIASSKAMIVEEHDEPTTPVFTGLTADFSDNQFNA